MADDDKPDERPRPKYGELAPEGWVWNPPADTGRLDTSKPAHDPAATPNASTNQPPHGVPAGQGAHRAHPDPARSSVGRAHAEAPPWNLTVTVTLLVIGLWGMTTSIATLFAVPTSIQQLHATENLGDYTASPGVSALLTAGAIIQAGIWAVSAGLSVWLLTRHRVSYYVPLLAGVLAFIAMVVVVSIVITNDTTLLEFLGGSTTPTPSITTPTPGIPTPTPGATP